MFMPIITTVHFTIVGEKGSSQNSAIPIRYGFFDEIKLNEHPKT